VAQWYRQAPAKMMNKEIDWNSDDIRATLHTSTYTPNLDTHAYVNDLTNELSTANGYTAGGLTLGSITGPTYTAANSWGTSAAVSTAYAVNDVVRPSTGNGYLYRCVVAGTSGGSAPTWPTVIGQTVTDGTVTWACAGKGIVTISAGNAVWASPSTFGPFRYLVISDRTPGTAATQPLIGLVDFTTDKTAQGGAVTEQWSAQGILQVLMS
jgi:hypothetical protein